MHARSAVSLVRVVGPIVTAGALSLAAAAGHAQAATSTTTTTTATPTATSATTTAATTPAPAPRTAEPYFVALQEGLAKLRGGDIAGAQIAFQRAVAADRSRSEGHYLLGVAMRHHQSLPAALDSFREALLKAQQASDLQAESRARFMIAVTLSDIGGHHHTDAARAWQDLIAFAEAHPAVLSPDVPRAYTGATERVAALATTMEPVRERIRQREHEARQPSHGSHGSHH